MVSFTLRENVFENVRRRLFSRTQRRAMLTEFSFMRLPVINTSTTLLERLRDRQDNAAWTRLNRLYCSLIRAWVGRQLPQQAEVDDRSAERRVGKECRSRW